MFELSLRCLKIGGISNFEFCSSEFSFLDGGRDLFRLDGGLISSGGSPLGVDIESDDFEDDVEVILELFRNLLLRICNPNKSIPFLFDDQPDRLLLREDDPASDASGVSQLFMGKERIFCHVASC